jgi:HD-GYP domain-containing protein (c-di-GMP phosphodiesterase class II)
VSDSPLDGDILEAESLGDLGEGPDGSVQDEGVLRDLPEYAAWDRGACRSQVPSLLLDRRLRIVRANNAFCRLFGCDPRVQGAYFTNFFSPFFTPGRSEELLRAVVSPEKCHSWTGSVERQGVDQMKITSAVMVVPQGAEEEPPRGAEEEPTAAPQAYKAVCIDITSRDRTQLQDTFMSLLEAARLKDNDTGNHIYRVNKYAQALAQDVAGLAWAPEVDRQFIASIGLVAALHDIGKIGTPDDILNKAGPLESWEWDVMKQHTTNGAFILGTYPNPMAAEIALRHHERWDGSGYPHQIGLDRLPLSARIVALADVYDALRMRRAYKEAYTHERAVQTIVNEKGRHFDPLLTSRFVAIAEDFRTIYSLLEDPLQQEGPRPVDVELR